MVATRHNATELELASTEKIKNTVNEFLDAIGLSYDGNPNFGAFSETVGKTYEVRKQKLQKKRGADFNIQREVEYALGLNTGLWMEDAGSIENKALLIALMLAFTLEYNRPAQISYVMRDKYGLGISEEDMYKLLYRGFTLLGTESVYSKKVVYKRPI